MPETKLYKVLFLHHGSLYELYAKRVEQGSLFGFVEVEGLSFGETSKVVVDPSEERLKAEFSSVKRTFIPLHSVVRIDEVDQQGVSKIREIPGGKASNVASFPFPIPGPGGDRGKKD